MANEDRFGPHVKKIGDKYYPMGRPTIHAENLWRERMWEVRRDLNGYCSFEFLGAAQGAGTITYELTVKEFDAVKLGDLTYKDLIELTDHDSDRCPIDN